MEVSLLRMSSGEEILAQRNKMVTSHREPQHVSTHQLEVQEGKKVRVNRVDSNWESTQEKELHQISKSKQKRKERKE